MPLFQISPAADGRFDILNDGRFLRSLRTIREAKAYRDAIDWAINDQQMANLPALTYADQRSKQELSEFLETDAPDEHFV